MKKKEEKITCDWCGAEATYTRTKDGIELHRACGSHKKFLTQ